MISLFFFFSLAGVFREVFLGFLCMVLGVFEGMAFWLPILRGGVRFGYVFWRFPLVY